MLRFFQTTFVIALIATSFTAVAQDDGDAPSVDDGGGPPPDNMPPPPPPAPPPLSGDGGEFDSGDAGSPDAPAPNRVPPGSPNPNSIQFDSGNEPSYSGRDLDIDGSVESRGPGIIKGNNTQDEEKGPPVSPAEVKKLKKDMDEKSFPKGGVKAVAAEVPPPRKIFGSYRLHVGVAKPTFREIDKYKDFYGETRFMPTIGVDYFFFDWFTTLGLTFKMGYYKDDGHPAAGKVREKDSDAVVTDKEENIELTLIPLQAGLAFQATPFPAKWLVLSGWFGVEALYFQEFRVVKSTASSTDDETTTDTTTTSTAFSMTTAETATDEDDETATETNKARLSSGWRTGTTAGVSLSFLLNGLDQKSIKSLRTMNMSGIYLSPYVEVTQNLSDKKLSFSRMVFGTAFTFETY